MSIGYMEISSEMLLDLLCFDPKTHRIVRVEEDLDPREICITIEGPDLPDSQPGVIPRVTPVYRRKEWERIEPQPRS